MPVADEAGRARWGNTPFVSLGPLHFGMSHERAAVAVEGGVRGITLLVSGTTWSAGRVLRLWRPPAPSSPT